jgi:hypothetical protein
MPISVESKEPLGDGLLKKIKRKIELASHTPSNVESLKGVQSGIWGLFGDMVIVSWTYAEKRAEYAEEAKKDANLLAAELPAILASLGLPDDTRARYILHEGVLLADMPIASQWRCLFAQAIIRMEHGEPLVDSSIPPTT